MIDESTILDIKKDEDEKQNENNSNKEILSKLLKKMLGHKLSKLEKKHIEESNTLKGISKISQNLIYSLEYYKHKMNKELYKIRHKNDENNSKKRSQENNNKSILKDKSLLKEEKYNIINQDNNLESLIETKENILENNPNNITHINKPKKPSKSLDAKKAKELRLTPEINNKEKKIIKKEKTDVFTRLASKSIGNFKKFKMTMSETYNTNKLNSKSKSKKLNTSKRKINNIQNKKNTDMNSKDDTPSRPEKKLDKEKMLKLTSTPKTKPKQLKKFSQINIDNSNNIDIYNSTKNINSKTLVNTASTTRIKKRNSKAKLHIDKKSLISGEKKEEKNLEENNNKYFEENNNDISVENRINEIKLENVILSDKDLLNNNYNEVKNSLINDKILIDEEILKNVNKDELLTTNIKEDKTNLIDINNIDSTLKDFSIKGIFNSNLDNNLTKSEIPEMKSSINSFNNNKNTNDNNIKLVNSLNKKEEEKKENESGKEKEKNEEKENKEIKEIEEKKEEEKEKKKEKMKGDERISDLDNIILPKRITSFLDNDKDINFSLINYSHNENDNINEHDDFNKTIDLNISGLSEHLSLEEKFESHLDEITRYLDTSELCNLMLVNKECYTTIMNILISKTEITIDILEEELTKLKDSNDGMNFNEIKINPFSFSSNSSRAVSLLNNSLGFSFTNLDGKTSKEIFIIFGIFFIAAGKKKEYLSLINNEQKMNYISNFFKKGTSLGNLIETEIKGKIFDDKTIASLYKYSYRYINIISPNRFQKINKDFAIFVFVVKNILEHIGVLEQNNKPEKEFILYNARLKNNKEMLEILNNYFDKIS